MYNTADYLLYIVLVSFILGAYVLKQGYKKKQNITFFVTCLGISLWVLGLFLLQQTNKFYWPDKLTLFGGQIMVAGLFYFSQVFPTDGKLIWSLKAKFSENAYVRLIPLLVVCILMPFNLFIRKIQLTGNTFEPVNGPLFPLYALVAGYYILSTVYFFAKQYLNNIGYTRQRVSYVILGLIFFLVCAIVFDVIFPALNISSFKFVGPFSSILFFVLGLFSIVSYNLLDIRIIFKSVLVYAFTITLAVIAMVGLYHSHAGPLLFAYPQFIFTIFTTIVFFVFVRVSFNWIFERYLMKSYYNSEESFTKLNNLLYELIDREDIIKNANDFLRQGLRLSWVYYFDAKTRRVIFGAKRDPIALGLLNLEQIQDEQLLEYAKSLHTPKFFFGVELPAFPKITNTPIALLPIWEHGAFQGYFLLGPQRTLTGLSRSEIRNIQAAWAHIETALDRAMLQENLEHKVAAQVEDITYKNKVLKEMLQGRLDFMQMASHQLRTPITTMSGYLQLLMKKGDPAEDKQMVRAAYEKSKSLADIVENILRLSKFDGVSEQEINECVDLDKVFGEILPIVEAAARPKDLYISYAKPAEEVCVFGNKTYLEQVFFNLLENAVQYTDQGGIIITFEDQGESCTVRIEDSGVGIDAQMKEEVFKKHVRTKTSKGIGLGLYIVKAIIDVHPGSAIWFESGPNGTTFFVRLKKCSKESAIISA